MRMRIHKNAIKSLYCVRTHTVERSEQGLTLVGLLIALTITAVIITGVVRLLSTSLDSTSENHSRLRMEQIAVRALSAISELIVQAGANLPAAEPSLSFSGNGDTLYVLRNPKGALFTFKFSVNNKRKVYVEDADPFLGATTVQRIIPPSTISQLTVSAYSAGDFISGVDTTNDSLRFSSLESYSAGEQIYLKQKDCIWLDSNTRELKHRILGTDLILAENVDSLQISFFELDGTATTVWTDIRTCSMRIVVSMGEKTHAIDRRILLRNRAYYDPIP